MITNAKSPERPHGKRRNLLEESIGRTPGANPEIIHKFANVFHVVGPDNVLPVPVRKNAQCSARSAQKEKHNPLRRRERIRFARSVFHSAESSDCIVVRVQRHSF